MNTFFPAGEELKRGNHEVVRRLTFQDMKVAIETDKGQFRNWHDHESGESGRTKMHYPYGYFMGTMRSGQSGDGMALDVFVGPEEKAEHVYVVHQMKKPDFKTFDELKVMVGFESLKQARAAYLCHYDKEGFLGDVDTLTVAEFKKKYLDDVAKALGYMGMTTYPATSAAGHAVGVPNPAGVPPNVPVPGMSGMMQPMGPPPIDVETLDGVESLLRRVGNVKDPELLAIVADIWGPGYQYVNASPELVRCEVMGFLLDQRALLKVAQEMRQPIAVPYV